MAHEKEYIIIVNGSQHTPLSNIVTFDQVVEIAFPGHPTNPDIVFSATFENAQHPHQGTLAAGGAGRSKATWNRLRGSSTSRKVALSSANSARSVGGFSRSIALRSGRAAAREVALEQSLVLHRRTVFRPQWGEDPWIFRVKQCRQLRRIREPRSEPHNDVT